MLNEPVMEYHQAGSDFSVQPCRRFFTTFPEALEKEFKDALLKDYGIVFNSLFTITNLPISRYLDYLLTNGNYEDIWKLVTAYNPFAART